MFAEVRLRTGSDLSGITVLRSVSGLAFDSKNNDTGAIQFALPLSDARSLGLDANSVVEILPNGLTVPNMWFGLDSSSGSQTVDGASMLSVNGKSLINWLADGVVYPSTWHFATTPSDYAVTVTGSKTQVVPRYYVPVVSTFSWNATTDLFTTPTAHNLTVGSIIQFTTVSNTTSGFAANQPYYVVNVPSSTTFAINTYNPASNLNLTASGTGTGLTKNTSVSDTSQTTIGGHAFENASPGFIMKTLVARCVERGGMGWLDTSSFSGTTSSDGTPWNTTLTNEYSNGTTLLQVIQDLATRRLIEYRMDGNSLKIFNYDTYHTKWTPDQITFRRGRNITEQTRSLDASGVASSVLIAGDDLALGEVSDSAIVSIIGRRREKFVTQAGITDIPTLVTLMGGAELSISGHILTEDTLGITDNDILPWGNFQVGDWVWADFDGSLKNIQIQQISASVQDAGNLQVGMTLGDVIQSADEKTQRLLDNITGGSGTNRGGLPDQKTGRPPKAPTGVNATATAYRDSNAKDFAQVQVSWTVPTQNIDNTTLSNLDRYEMQYKLGTSLVWTDSASIPASNEVIAGFISNLPSGQAFQARVRAVNSDNYASNWANSNVINALPKVVVTPPTPNAPNLSGTLGGVQVYWNGMDVTSSYYGIDFDRAEVHLSLTSASFTPTAATRVGTIGALGGSTVIQGLTYGTTYYAKIVVVDKSGNSSAASAGSNGAAPSQATTTDLATNSVTTQQIQNQAVSAAKIAVGAINTNTLSVASFGDSVVPNGSFEEVTTNPTVDTTGAAGWKFVSYPGNTTAATGTLVSDSSAGANAFRIDVPAGTNGGMVAASSPIPTSNPDIFYVTFKAKSSVQMGKGVSVIASLGDTAVESSTLTHNAGHGTNIVALSDAGASGPDNGYFYTYADGYYEYEVSFTVPYNATYMYKYVTLFVGAAQVAHTSAYSLYLDQISMRPVGGSASITDLTVSKLTGGTLSADVLLAGTITTAYTGARVTLDSTGIYTYNSAGFGTLQVSSDDGSVLMNGTLQVPASALVDDRTFPGQVTVNENGFIEFLRGSVNLAESSGPNNINGYPMMTRTFSGQLNGLLSGTTGGTWKIGFRGVYSAALAYNATATSVQTALNGLSTVTAAGLTFTVTDGSDGFGTSGFGVSGANGYIINTTVIGYVPEIVGDFTNLTGFTSGAYGFFIPADVYSLFVTKEQRGLHPVTTVHANTVVKNATQPSNPYASGPRPYDAVAIEISNSVSTTGRVRIPVTYYRGPYSLGTYPDSSYVILPNSTYIISWFVDIGSGYYNAAGIRVLSSSYLTPTSYTTLSTGVDGLIQNAAAQVSEYSVDPPALIKYDTKNTGLLSSGNGGGYVRCFATFTTPTTMTPGDRITLELPVPVDYNGNVTTGTQFVNAVQIEKATPNALPTRFIDWTDDGTSTNRQDSVISFSTFADSYVAGRTSMEDLRVKELDVGTRGTSYAENTRLNSGLHVVGNVSASSLNGEWRSVNTVNNGTGRTDTTQNVFYAKRTITSANSDLFQAYEPFTYAPWRYRAGGGFCYFEGVSNTQTPGANRALGQLPKQYCPDYQVICLGTMGGAPYTARIDIKTSGEVSLTSIYGGVASGNVYLNNVVFPMASQIGDNEWTYIGATGAPAFQNSWTNYNATGGTYAGARYYVDNAGYVHLSGLIKGGTNSTIFQLPVEISQGMQYGSTNLVAANGAPARITVSANGAVSLSGFISGGTNGYVSLDGISFKAFNYTDYGYVGSGGEMSATSVTYQNSWTTYSAASYGPLRLFRDINGLAHLSGLVAGGTAGTAVTRSLPDWMTPTYRLAIPILMAGTVSGRVDITPDGIINITNFGGGTNTYAALDWISWFPNV